MCAIMMFSQSSTMIAGLKLVRLLSTGPVQEFVQTSIYVYKRCECMDGL